MARPRKATPGAVSTVAAAAVSTSLDCSKYSALAPDARALIYTGISNMRDLAIIAKSVEACGLTCEVVRGVAGDEPTVSVFAARRKAPGA